MPCRFDGHVDIDRPTSVAIRKAIAENLSRIAPVDLAPLPPPLRRLIEALNRQDEDRAGRPH